MVRTVQYEMWYVINYNVFYILILVSFQVGVQLKQYFRPHQKKPRPLTHGCKTCIPWWVTFLSLPIHYFITSWILPIFLVSAIESTIMKASCYHHAPWITWYRVLFLGLILAALNLTWSLGPGRCFTKAFRKWKWLLHCWLCIEKGAPKRYRNHTLDAI